MNDNYQDGYAAGYEAAMNERAEDLLSRLHCGRCGIRDESVRGYGLLDSEMRPYLTCLKCHEEREEGLW